MGTVITLPRELATRSAARHLVPARVDTDIVLDASHLRVRRIAAVDELVKSLIATGTDRIIVVNADASTQVMVRGVHRARARPGQSFLLIFRDIAAEALLGPCEPRPGTRRSGMAP